MVKKGKFLFVNDPPAETGRYEIHHGDALERLRIMPDGMVRCWVTSPPYFKKIDYGCEGQAGLEQTVDEYVNYQQAVAKEMLRVSTPDANVFWVLQDTHNWTGGTGSDYRKNGDYTFVVRGPRERSWPRHAPLLIPNRIQQAFIDVGWTPRLTIIWNKEDPRRASLREPSYSYEHILRFSAGHDRYWNREAVLQQASERSQEQLKKEYRGQGTRDYAATGQEDPSHLKRRMISAMTKRPEGGVLLRGVWHIPSGSQPVVMIDGRKHEGKASFPLLLAEICVNLASEPGDIIFDPYSGMGTTLLAAVMWGRHAIGIELNQKDIQASKIRIEEMRAKNHGQLSLAGIQGG